MQEDRIKIKALLETYSIKEISTIFSGIDNKLMSLHKCSADDFLKLNDDFKKLYSQSKIISDNVNEVLALYDNNENISLYKEIHEFYDNLKNQIELFDNRITVTMKFMEELSSHLRFIFFPIKNYAQNLMSLKYLIANLNLTISYTDQNDNLAKISKSIDRSIDELKLFAERISKNLNHLSKITKISISNFSLIKNQSEVNIEHLLSIVKSRIDIVEEKFNSNKHCIPTIRKKTEKSADSISDIIKKLQYQDIIKQKMEHIQQTHKDILNELNHFENIEPNDTHMNEKAKFFLRVRDIAGLQAAQLIQANKEYQSAIEIIINNFMQIGDNMKGISEMCGTINDTDQNSEIELFREITDQIKTTEEGLLTKFDQNKKLYKDVVLIDNQLKQSDIYSRMFKDLNNKLADLTNTLFVELKNVPGVSENISKAILQVEELNIEIRTNGTTLEELIDKLLPIKARIQGFITQHNELNLSADFTAIKEVAVKLNTVREKINSALSGNQLISKEVLDNIRKSIANIKYYDYFESIIEEIITELNTINYNLKIDDESAKTKDENLEQLKEYYTMETEHIIHDKVTKGEELDDYVESDDDGDIEFF